jgi:hypothetical protein
VMTPRQRKKSRPTRRRARGWTTFGRRPPIRPTPRQNERIRRW